MLCVLPLMHGTLPFARRPGPSCSWPAACGSAITAVRYQVLRWRAQQQRLPQLHSARVPPRLPFQEDHLKAARGAPSNKFDSQ